jgi:hypothetical protein
MPITNDTISIIYAYDDADPTSVDQIKKHKFHKRGSKSLFLLTYKISNPLQEDDLKTFVIAFNDV